ncbi:MAG: radical SAM protein [Lachnospiraceae bacterium]|nr:radical SAM protein [Lachnospiraceae bacterium]
MDKKIFKRIYVEITNCCNLACSFCPQDPRKKMTMTLGQFSHIIKEIVPFTDYVYLHIKGEPLLHPDLPKMLALCHENKIYANITTNGTLFEKNQYFKTPIPGLRQVNISLHSFDANEKERTGLSFEEYLNQCFRQAEYFSEYTKTITAFRLWNLQPDTALSEENKKILEQMKEFFRLAELPLPQGGRGVKIKENIYLNFDKEFVWPDLSLPIISEEGYCHGGMDQLGILVDGRVVPCCLDQNGVIALGNIFETPFKEIIEGERLKNLQKGFRQRCLKEELCKKCGYATRFVAAKKKER